ncbi:hypothetical protein CDD81_4725 [Ophiocordyceps australis]|uniref:Brl1/Brr6 domain-containing protein n=1 Tax=Ophiocordyceps australis TaxID=1399860 RepID=A0A2C5XJ01_9HYPO|nr:hypothetical protein CDD81_4725 [Ophiocordyceps australis]
MASRGTEGHMDWKFDGPAPTDGTSPFAQAAKRAASTAPPFRSFAAAAAPSTPLFRPPQHHQPQLQPQQTPLQQPASPFRNPAFTTPRKPFDDDMLSEYSPSLTEASEDPPDTPEGEWRPGAMLDGPIAPSKIDKTSRYSRQGQAVRKHTPGKGEIAAYRHLPIGARSRKRQAYDKDVGAPGRIHGTQESDEWNSGADSGAGPRGGKPSRGIVEAFLHILNKYPNTPDHLLRWLVFCSKFALVTGLSFIGWSVVSTVRNDLSVANDLARTELMSKMTECQTQYTMNECSKRDRPALRIMCEQWYDCMVQNPGSISSIKVTAKQVAEILNEFAGTMSLKAWALVMVLLTLMASIVSNFGRRVRSPATPRAKTVAGSTAPETAGYMLVPVQTPQTERRALTGQDINSDALPLNLGTAANASPVRRSPKKNERYMSPVDWARSPRRGF